MKGGGDSWQEVAVGKMVLKYSPYNKYALYNATEQLAEISKISPK